MKNFNALFLAVIFCFFGLNEAVAQDLRFAIPDYLPFTGKIDGKPGGIGVDLAEKIVKEAGLSMTVHVVPNYSRCVIEVESNEADGFFLGSRNDERDAVAVMTDQIMINNWMWVLPQKSTMKASDANFKSKARIGVMLNTNPHTWLKNNGYIIAGTPTTSDSLLKMLEAERLDAVLIPEMVFNEAIKRISGSRDNYNVTIQSSQPFGMYISKKYIASNPGIMEKLKAAIKKVTAK